MARLRQLSDDEVTPEVRAIFEGARQLTGRVPSLLRILAHSPQQARWFVPLLVAVQRMTEGTALEGRLRSLAILRTSALNSCAY